MIEYNNLNATVGITALILPINGYYLIIGWHTVASER